MINIWLQFVLNSLLGVLQSNVTVYGGHKRTHWQQHELSTCCIFKLKHLQQDERADCRHKYTHSKTPSRHKPKELKNQNRHVRMKMRKQGKQGKTYPTVYMSTNLKLCRHFLCCFTQKMQILCFSFSCQMCKSKMKC